MKYQRHSSDSHRQTPYSRPRAAAYHPDLAGLPHCRWADCQTLLSVSLSGRQLLEHWRQCHIEEYRTQSKDSKQTVACRWGNCKRLIRPGSYSAEAHMRGHFAREFGWKEFRCDSCLVRFTRRPDLTAHCKKHHPEGTNNDLNTPPATPNLNRGVSSLPSPMASPVFSDSTSLLSPSSDMVRQESMSTIDSNSQGSLSVSQNPLVTLYSPTSPVITDQSVIYPSLSQVTVDQQEQLFPTISNTGVLPQVIACMPDSPTVSTIQPHAICSGPLSEKLASSPTIESSGLPPISLNQLDEILRTFNIMARDNNPQPM